ncbi:hypothetical protein [Bowmanella denitrificans]|uniref:hypothetical protein n=1 Tax=Bowmanella denitrificans TaxID=366582 RepID=UPI0011AF067E|nr:hypothetical protein [Bowmanella denitrificans]
MSSINVENIHIRVAEELDRLGLSKAEAARQVGHASSQVLRDVCSGRQRATAALVAELAPLGLDVNYVLLGTKGGSGLPEQAIVDGLKRFLLTGYDLGWLRMAPDASFDLVVKLGLHQIKMAAGEPSEFVQETGEESERTAR